MLYQINVQVHLVTYWTRFEIPFQIMLHALQTMEPYQFYILVSVVERQSAASLCALRNGIQIPIDCQQQLKFINGQAGDSLENVLYL